MKKSKKIKATKKEKIFFLITLVSVIVAIGAIVHAQTGQGHDWGEIDFTGVGACSNICTDQDTDTHLSKENVQDYCGAMAGTHLTYDDGGNKLNAAWPSLICTYPSHTVDCGTVHGACESYAQCPSGYKVTGGGCHIYPDKDKTGARINLVYWRSVPSSVDNKWKCQVENQESKHVYITAYAVCCKVA